MDTVLAATSDNFAISKVSAVELSQGNVAMLYYDKDRYMWLLDSYLDQLLIRKFEIDNVMFINFD